MLLALAEAVLGRQRSTEEGGEGCQEVGVDVNRGVGRGYEEGCEGMAGEILR